MNKIKIEEIYKILAKGLPLTKETLSIYKFTDEEIKSLLDEEIIKETDKGNYTLSSIDGMYNYGIYLELKHQPKRSENYFRQCYKIDPTNRKVCMKLLLIELKSHNYNAISRFFSLLEKISKDEYIEDNKLYLYLLSVVLYKNEEYQERIKNIEYDEMLIPEEKEYPHKQKQNEIRKAIIKQKYKYATKLINDLIRENLSYNVEYELLKELVSQALHLNVKSKIRISAQNKEYQYIVNTLESKSKNQHLGNRETYILAVSKAIIKIIETKEIPVIETQDITCMHNAIQGNNFKLARTINLAFVEKINQDPNEDILNILLNDIIKRIEDLELSNSIEEPAQSETINTTSNNEKITIKEAKTLTPDEELAYYIKEMDISLTEATKTIGILPEQAIIIKLIYARDYFFEENYEEGNKLLQEVENIQINSDKITELLKEIKETIISKNIKTNSHIKSKN